MGKAHRKPAFKVAHLAAGGIVFVLLYFSCNLKRDNDTYSPGQPGKTRRDEGYHSRDPLFRPTHVFPAKAGTHFNCRILAGFLMQAVT